MTDPSTIETTLAHCENIRTLLERLERFLRQEPAGTRAETMRLAGKERAFAESLNDAICLYLQRPDSGLDQAQSEFEPMLEMLAELKRPHSTRILMDWLDRHRHATRPTEEREKRFALAVWALMRVTAQDSKVFVEWWMERADTHQDDWLGAHFDPDAIAPKD